MAARVLLQRRAAPVTAALLVGGIAFYPSVAYAEAPTSNHTSRKPIYDDFDALEPIPTTAKPSAAAAVEAQPPTTDVVAVVPASTPSSPVVEIRRQQQQPQQQQQQQQSLQSALFGSPSPTDRLAAQIRLGRLFLYRQACAAEDGVNGAMSRAFDLEHSFTSTLASLAPPRQSGEKLMPGLIYTLVAGMAGSIVARNRNLLVRASLPLAFGLGAAWTVIPITMANVGELVWKYEQKVPALADTHLRTRQGIEQGVYMAKVHSELAQRKLEEAVGQAREAVEGWVRKGK